MEFGHGSDLTLATCPPLTPHPSHPAYMPHTRYGGSRTTWRTQLSIVWVLGLNLGLLGLSVLGTSGSWLPAAMALQQLVSAAPPSASVPALCTGAHCLQACTIGWCGQLDLSCSVVLGSVVVCVSAGCSACSFWAASICQTQAELAALLLPLTLIPP